MSLGALNNFTSLEAQFAFSQTQNTLASTIQRLSSGLRIQSGADDAAGLAISSRLTSQINGLNQAGRNVNDGISLVQTADGVLASISSQLQSLRTMAVQASTATYSAADRSSLNQQAQDLLNTIQASVLGAQFNRMALLDGTFTGHQIQVGAGAHQVMSISLANHQIGALGSFQITTGTLPGSAFTSSNTIKINQTTTIGASVSDSSNVGFSSDSAYALGVAINAQSASTGVTATASTTLTGSAPTVSTPLVSGDLVINGTSIGSTTGSSSALTQGSQVQTAINALSATTGVTASVNSSTGVLTLNASDGRNIVLSINTNGGLASGLSSGTFYGKLALSSANPFSVTEVGSDTNFSNLTSPSLSALSSISLSSASNASNAIGVIDSAIAQIDTSRTSLGAYQNQLQATTSQLFQSSNDASNSLSRIRDTDFAAETSRLVSAQVLQSVQAAMLTQANTLPGSIAVLLKGLPGTSLSGVNG